MPQTAARWGIHVIHRDRKALRARRRTGPVDLWRNIAALATSPDLIQREGSAVWQHGAGYLERRRTPIDNDRGGFGEHVAVRAAINPCPGRFLIDSQLGCLVGIDADQVTMRTVTLRRAWPEVAHDAQIIGAHDRACGQQILGRVARACGQTRGAGWDVEYQPVPQTAARRRIHVIHGDRETLCAGRRAGPVDLWRNIAARAAVRIAGLLYCEDAVFH